MAEKVEAQGVGRLTWTCHLPGTGEATKGSPKWGAGGGTLRDMFLKELFYFNIVSLHVDIKVIVHI